VAHPTVISLELTRSDACRDMSRQASSKRLLRIGASATRPPDALMPHYLVYERPPKCRFDCSRHPQLRPGRP
jgi:hypothetical protein